MNEEHRVDDEPRVERSDDREAGTGEPGVADGELRPVDRSWVTVKRITTAIASVILLVPVAIGTMIAWIAGASVPLAGRIAAAGVLVVLVAVLTWSATALPALRYRHFRYRVDRGGLTIRSGIWWRSDVRVPRTRVQHTDVTQGPLERSFDLATLVVFTAGTEHARVSLEGLQAERAGRIRDFLVSAREDDGV